MISDSSISIETGTAPSIRNGVTKSGASKSGPFKSGGESPTEKDRSVETCQPARYFATKYIMERVLGLFLLVPALPLILILVCLVRLTSKGPAIYRQHRVGLKGQVFSMLKIRTMIVDAEAGGPQWSMPRDPRTTHFGRFLRFLHLDELPQLINVVKGEMAIVGPRPERPEFVDMLIGEVEGYADRLKVKPGITGLAQIYLPPDETTDCVRRKVCFDRAYIQTATAGVDLRIYLCTLVRMFGIRKGFGPRWFGLDHRYQHVKRQCEAFANGSDDYSQQRLDIGSSDVAACCVRSTNGVAGPHQARPQPHHAPNRPR